MRRILPCFFLLLLATSCVAQWKKIYDFPTTDELGNPNSQPITAIYFLDLPGAPRIGYVGTETQLWKTTDGGMSWAVSWTNPYGRASYGLYYVTDICFKDTMVGWFSIFGDTDACYG